MGLAKLERALRGGGMAERVRNQGYRVWRCRNRQRRSVGMLPLQTGDALRAEGKIRLRSGETQLYEWSVKPAQTPRVLNTVEVLYERDRKAPRNFLDRAIEAGKDSRERKRLAAVAREISSDFDQLSNPQSLTMNWDQLALGRVDETRVERTRPRSHRSGVALKRLQMLSDNIGNEAWSLLTWTFVGELSCREIARRLNKSAPQAVVCLTRTLREVADIYDNNLRRRE